MARSTSEPWLALAIGNSRLHWAWFVDNDLKYAWNTHYLNADDIDQLIANHFNLQHCRLLPDSAQIPVWELLPELWMTSVVPQQTIVWQRYAKANMITLEQLPITGMYLTLGSDRAIALWGALVTYGSPVLVIDGGTALTLTGAAGNRLVGGAILPGLQLQFRSLGQSTAALPLLQTPELAQIPTRWALDTPNAIQSGIIYSVLDGIRGFIQDWLQQFPQSAIVFTGGDGAFLFSYLHLEAQFSELSKLDENLIFWGIRSVRQTAILG